MKAIVRLKLLNAIGYFAQEHYRRTGNFLTQIYLFKYLAFLDFQSVKERGRPVIGLKYLAMKWGPVPKSLYREFSELEGSKVYETFRVNVRVDDLRERQWIEIAPLEGREPDLKLFSEYERKLMEKLVEIFADRFVKTKHFSEASHQEIVAWRKAWEKAQKLKKGAYPMNYGEELKSVKDSEERNELLERLETFEYLLGE